MIYRDTCDQLTQSACAWQDTTRTAVKPKGTQAVTVVSLLVVLLAPLELLVAAQHVEVQAVRGELRG